MADLDAELALFQAEVQAIEDTNAKEEEAKAAEEEKVVKKQKVSYEPEVIIAAPQRNVTEVLPQPTRLSYNNSKIPAALSGFIPGTSGEGAAIGPSKPEASVFPVTRMPISSGPVTHIDMTTGAPLPDSEQSKLAAQQSVYDYNPSRQISSSSTTNSTSEKRPKFVRMGGGQVWEDKTLADWPDNDFRLFVGNIGNEVSDEILSFAFASFASFQKAKVVREKHSQKTKGYGFVSFADPFDAAKAMREMNGKYIGNRPVKITKSKWQERDIKVAKKKNRKKRKNHLFA